MQLGHYSQNYYACHCNFPLIFTFVVTSCDIIKEIYRGNGITMIVKIYGNLVDQGNKSGVFAFEGNCGDELV